MQVPVIILTKDKGDLSKNHIFPDYQSHRVAHTQGHMSCHMVTACAGWYSDVTCVPVWEQLRNPCRHRVWETTTGSSCYHGDQPLFPWLWETNILATSAPFPPTTNRNLEMWEWEGLQWNMVTAGWMKGGRWLQQLMLLVLFLRFWCVLILRMWFLISK